MEINQTGVNCPFLISEVYVIRTIIPLILIKQKQKKRGSEFISRVYLFLFHFLSRSFSSGCIVFFFWFVCGHWSWNGENYLTVKRLIALLYLAFGFEIDTALLFPVCRARLSFARKELRGANLFLWKRNKCDTDPLKMQENETKRREWHITEMIFFPSRLLMRFTMFALPPQNWFCVLRNWSIFS